MATRSTIKIEGIDFAKVYKHWDGYPDAMNGWLIDFNTKFTRNRGDDPEYKFAQLLRSSINDASKYNLDPSTETGWGVVGYNENFGEEYEYTLHADGSITYKKI
jgi:hypothetical protein